LKDYPDSPTPIISGNVSFYNESATGRAVPPSPIIACVGVLQDYSKAVTMQLKQPADKLYLVGPRKDELGGSAYYQALGLGLGRNVPKIDWPQEEAMIWAVIDAIEAGHIAACQDISDGGVVVALAEMALGGFGTGELGVAVNIGDEVLDGLRADKWLFSESTGFVMEVCSGHEQQVEKLFADHSLELLELGTVTSDPQFQISVADECLINLAFDEARDAWTNGLAAVLS